MIADEEQQFRDMLIDISPDMREDWKATTMKQLRAAAESVGFHRLTEVQAFWRQYGEREDYYDLLYAYTRSIP
jgi:hypothetical protein